MITPMLRKPAKSLKTTRISGHFGKIAGFLTCLVENRGVGVTTTLGPGDFLILRVVTCIQTITVVGDSFARGHSQFLTFFGDFTHG